MIGVSNRARELTGVIPAPPPESRHFVASVDAGVVPVCSALSPVEVGGKYMFRGWFRPLLNTELESYLAKVRVASSSLVSRSTP
jgi:hypothetical protein